MSVFTRRRRHAGRAEAPQPAPVTVPDGYRPHGIATPQTLAGLVARAQAETAAQAHGEPAAAPWGPWDYPGSFPAALNGQPGHYGCDLTSMDNPPAHHRPYAPDPLARQPLSFTADFRELPAFRAAVRVAGHAPGGRVRSAGSLPAMPDFRLPELMHKNFAGMLAMHAGRAA